MSATKSFLLSFYLYQKYIMHTTTAEEKFTLFRFSEQKKQMPHGRKNTLNTHVARKKI